MSHEGSLDVLLSDVLDDFESLLRTAKNGPAKRRLSGRIERLKLAIAHNDQRSPSKVSGMSRVAGARARD